MLPRSIANLWADSPQRGELIIIRSKLSEARFRLASVSFVATEILEKRCFGMMFLNDVVKPSDDEMIRRLYVCSNNGI